MESILVYKDTQQDKHWFVFERNDEKHYFFIIPMNDIFSKITGSTEDGKETPLDQAYTMKSDEGGWASMIQGTFAVAYADNYTLYYKDEVVIKLQCRRQQVEQCYRGTKRLL